MVSLAIAALVVAAVLSAVLAAVRHLAPNEVQSLLRELASSELFVAVNLAKYQGSTLAPASVATTVPMPVGTPLPVNLRLETRTSSAGALQITVTASTPAACNRQP